MKWFSRLSVRWKLQLGFFLVTMITTVYNRVLAVYELDNMIDIARQGGASLSLIASLEAERQQWIIHAIWESGLEFAVQFVVIGLAARLFVQPILALRDALAAMQKGDLTHAVPATAEDEVGELQVSFEVMRQKMAAILGQIEDSGRQVNQSAYQVTTLAREIAEVSEKEEQRSSEVSAATKSLQAIASQVLEQAQQAAGRAIELENRGREGIESVERNIDGLEQTSQQVATASQRIAELEASTSQINDIISTIKEIAGQTNLLALNAAIEAARAGELGRGFAVVADEVRKLAERSTSSAEEVNRIITSLNESVVQVTDSMHSVVEGVQNSREVAASTVAVIENMVGEIARTAEGSRHITGASEEQMREFDRLEETLAALFTTLRESSSKVATTASIGDTIFRISEQLNQTMAGFVLERKVKAQPANHEKRRHPRSDTPLLARVLHHGENVEAATLDLSISGIRIASIAELKSDEPVKLELFLPQQSLDAYQNQKPLQLDGKVAWAQPAKNIGDSNTYGLQFSKLTSAQEAALRACLAFYHRPVEFQ